MDGVQLTSAEKWIYDNAEVLAEKFISEKGSFVIPRNRYHEDWQQELMRKLLNLKEVENVLPCEEGLRVFLY